MILPISKKKNLLIWIKNFAKILLAIMFTILFLYFIKNSSLLEKGIGIFAIFAIIFTIPSIYCFIVALVLVIYIPLMQLINYQKYIDSLSLSVFYFLCIGLAIAFIEVYKPKNIVSRSISHNSSNTSASASTKLEKHQESNNTKIESKSQAKRQNTNKKRGTYKLKPPVTTARKKSFDIIRPLSIKKK